MLESLVAAPEGLPPFIYGRYDAETPFTMQASNSLMLWNGLKFGTQV